MTNARLLRSVVACAVLATAFAACSDDDPIGIGVSVPGAPTIGTATAGNASASIAFTAPAGDGGATITGYTASCTGGGATRTGTATASPISVTSLTNGTAYSCTVTATNSAGTSAASGAVTVTPTAVSGSVTTASVLCPASGSYAGTYSGVAITSTWAWTCSGTARSLTANGLPNHAVGTFPNPGNPNGITAQAVTFSAPLTPVKATTNRSIGGPGGANVVSIAGVKFDPGTAMLVGRLAEQS